MSGTKRPATSSSQEDGEGSGAAKNPRMEQENGITVNGLTVQEEQELTALYRKQEAIFQQHLIIRQRLIRQELLGGIPSINDNIVIREIEEDSRAADVRIEELENLGKERLARIEGHNHNNNNNNQVTASRGAPGQG